MISRKTNKTVKVKKKWLVLTMAGTFLLAGMFLAGCKSVAESNLRETKWDLTRAGFKKLEADTPEKLARLKALAQWEVTRATRNGQVFYYYADAIDSKSLYVGKLENYQRYRGIDIHGNKAETHHNEAVNEVVDLRMMAADSWAVWGPWAGWW